MEMGDGSLERIKLDGDLRDARIDGSPAKLNGHLRFSEIIRTVRGRGFMFVPPPPPQRTLRLVSESQLILREIVPDDQPFLGWDPTEVLDTFFILAPQPWLYEHPHMARALTTTLVLAGVSTISGPFNVRRADGGLHIADGNATLHARARRFTGLGATLLL